MLKKCQVHIKKQAKLLEDTKKNGYRNYTALIPGKKAPILILKKW